MSRANLKVEMFVHFDDGDPAGIMFFANYFRLAERAWELALVKNGLDWKDWFRHEEWGIPLKMVQAEYHAMLMPGQTCTIQIGVKKIGDSSVTFQYEIHDSKGIHCATLQTTHVFVDKETVKKRGVPDHLRKFLKAQQL